MSDRLDALVRAYRAEHGSVDPPAATVTRARLLRSVRRRAGRRRAALTAAVVLGLLASNSVTWAWTSGRLQAALDRLSDRARPTAPRRPTAHPTTPASEAQALPRASAAHAADRHERPPTTAAPDSRTLERRPRHPASGRRGPAAPAGRRAVRRAAPVEADVPADGSRARTTPGRAPSGSAPSHRPGPARRAEASEARGERTDQGPRTGAEPDRLGRRERPTLGFGPPGERADGDRPASTPEPGSRPGRLADALDELTARERSGSPVDPEERRAFEAAHERHFTGAWSEALRLWDAYLTEHSGGRFAPEARFNRAVCLLRLGRAAEAREALLSITRSPRRSPHRMDAERLLRALDEGRIRR